MWKKSDIQFTFYLFFGYSSIRVGELITFFLKKAKKYDWLPVPFTKRKWSYLLKKKKKRKKENDPFFKKKKKNMKS